MEKKIVYTDETREELIAKEEASGLRLKEDQRHFDGLFLIFTDEPYIEEKEAEEIRRLET